VADNDVQWPFSFANLCDALGFSAQALRARLLASAPIPPLDAAGVDVKVAVRRRRRGPTEQDVIDMIRAGHPLRTVAKRFGISVSKASALSGGLASRMKAERDEEIRGLLRQGWSHGAIASHFGVTRNRVMRICARPDPANDRTAA
jgi:DNA-binding CsgD family transcriptional regulator